MIGYNGFSNGLKYNMHTHEGVGERYTNTHISSKKQVHNGYGRNQHGSGNSYAKNQILTASPEQILIMLFDAAIRFNLEAQTANNTGKTGLKLEKIGRVFNIISELSNTLDHAVGGEVAEELDALYQFHLEELGKARTDKTNKHLKFVEKFLVEWRETWLEVIKINKTATTNKMQQEQITESQQFTAAG